VRRSLLVSLVLHALAIALLLTIAPELPRVRFGRVIPIASPYRAPTPVAGKPNIPAQRPLRTAVRAFRAPHGLPQLVPTELTPVLADPPSILATPIFAMVPTLRLPDVQPPPVRRPVAVVGAFDKTIPSNQTVERTEISTGTFGDASAAVAGSRSSRASDAAISSAAEILLKPRPAYSDEARRLRIEGEVLLEVQFGASGEARVLRLIQGLGHGLDENAIAAARAIQFRPAKRGDSAVDSTAVVHIVFQLAY
jgi:TonB family protein